MESASPRLDLSLEAEDKDQPGMLGPQEKPLWDGSGNFCIAPQHNEQWGREGKQERRQPGSISVTTAINPGVLSQSPNYGERGFKK